MAFLDSEEKKERIASMWEIANKIVERDGEISAPIVILSYYGEKHLAILNGCNFNTKEEFREAIFRAVETVEADSAMMIASAKAVKKEDSASKVEIDDTAKDYTNIVLFSYKSKDLNLQQIAPIEVSTEGMKSIGKVNTFKGLISNSFFDGLFDVVQ